MDQQKSTTESALPMIAAFAVSPFFVWAVYHSIRSRTLEDFIRYSAYIAAPITIIGLIALLIAWKGAGFRRPSMEEILPIVVAPFLFLLMGATYYALAAALKDAYLWLQAPSSYGAAAVLITTLTTLVLGLGLYYFRFKLRSLYGLTEMLVGLAVAAQRAWGVSQVLDTSFYLTVLTAGVYLVVRGCDNVYTGLTKDPRDPLAIALLDYFKAMSARTNASRSTPVTS